MIRLARFRTRFVEIQAAGKDFVTESEMSVSISIQRHGIGHLPFSGGPDPCLPFPLVDCNGIHCRFESPCLGMVKRVFAQSPSAIHFDQRQRDFQFKPNQNSLSCAAITC